MTPDDLVREFARFTDIGVRLDEIVEKAARDALKGKRAVGHRIAMSGRTIRVSGPGAPVVAKQAAEIVGKAAERAVRGALP